MKKCNFVTKKIRRFVTKFRVILPVHIKIKGA
nr:MAG TPA: hypothetical protein [Caudoviricetes sp.]